MNLCVKINYINYEQKTETLAVRLQIYNLNTKIVFIKIKVQSWFLSKIKNLLNHILLGY